MNDNDTVLEALAGRLREAAACGGDEVAPACVLWPDKAAQWTPFLSGLRALVPVLTLGNFAPNEGQGPAIWLRCAIAGTVQTPEGTPPGTPVLYLPGVGFDELANIAALPSLLQPLAELQYRGVVWTRPGGRDWTVDAFITESGGLGIATAGPGVADALVQAREKLPNIRVADLRAQAPLTKAKVERLVVGSDFVGDLLRWMSNPAVKASRSAEEWSIFRSRCQEDYAFDPDTDGELAAAERLGNRAGNWAEVWKRFEESPRIYAGLPGLLRRVKPSDSPLYKDAGTWPQDNEEAEAALRVALSGLSGTDAGTAADRIATLAKEHRPRQTSVWATLGKAPLAGAMTALEALIKAVRVPLPGATATELAASWAKYGWRADAAVLEALAKVSLDEDAAAVGASARAVYRPWLSALTERYQDLALDAPPPTAKATPTPNGTCILFTDGLRWDIAQRLQDELEAVGRTVDAGWVFAPLPTITATCKPWLSPAAGRFTAGVEFGTKVASSGSAVTPSVFREQLTQEGYQVLDAGDTGDPAGKAWTECGNLDHSGHNEGWRLALRVSETLVAIRERVGKLLDAGWKDVRVITDHGWLLLPDGLPKADLPEHLTEKRKGRCARIKPASTVSAPVVPWAWDPDVSIAVAPGISCFEAGKSYEHGGLSPQETVIPILRISAGAAAQTEAVIHSVKWRGMRCLVEAEGGSSVALRDKANDPDTTLAGPKPVGSEGKANLPVADDTRSGQAVVVVLLDAGGNPVARRSTIIGEGD